MEYSTQVINFDKHEDKKLFSKFYYNVLNTAFPDVNERDSLERIITENKYFHRFVMIEHFCIIAMDGQEIAGGIIGDYFSRQKTCVIEYIVTAPPYRGKGVTNALFGALYREIERIFASTPEYCFFETEIPAKMSPEDKETCLKRLKYWSHKGASKLAFTYLQPPLEKVKACVTHMYFACLPMRGDNVTQIDKRIVWETLFNFFHYAFRQREHSAAEYANKAVGKCGEYIQLEPFETE